MDRSYFKDLQECNRYVEQTSQSREESRESGRLVTTPMSSMYESRKFSAPDTQGYVQQASQCEESLKQMTIPILNETSSSWNQNQKLSEFYQRRFLEDEANNINPWPQQTHPTFYTRSQWDQREAAHQMVNLGKSSHTSTTSHSGTKISDTIARKDTSMPSQISNVNVGHSPSNNISQPVIKEFVVQRFESDQIEKNEFEKTVRLLTTPDVLDGTTQTVVNQTQTSSVNVNQSCNSPTNEVKTPGKRDGVTQTVSNISEASSADLKDRTSVDVGSQASVTLQDIQCQTETEKREPIPVVKIRSTNSTDFKIKKRTTEPRQDLDYLPKKKRTYFLDTNSEDSPSKSTRQKSNSDSSFDASLLNICLSDDDEDEDDVKDEDEDDVKDEDVDEDDSDDVPESDESAEWDSKNPYRKSRSKSRKSNIRKPDSDAVIALKLRKPFKCPFCHKRFIKDESLNNHTLNSCTKNRRGNTFICSECGDHFVKFSIYRKHLKSHAGEFYKCTCGEKFQDYFKLKIHRDEMSLEGDGHQEVHPYSCNVCFKTFIHEGRYKRHMITHENNAKIACTVCGKEFEKGYMEIHERIHSGHKPFTCEYESCDMSYPSKKLLQRHQRVHYDEFKLPCTFCDKVFTQRSRLKDHLRVHTGEKLYICEICGSSFSRTNHLRRHTLTHSKKEVMLTNETDYNMTDGVKYPIKSDLIPSLPGLVNGGITFPGMGNLK